MIARESIRRAYFGYHPLGNHASDCRAGTGPDGNGGWEVSMASEERYAIDPATNDEHVEVRADVRLLCRECGSVVLLHLQGSSYEYTHVSQIGYGSKPERCAGIYLHPGPPILIHDSRGPWDYYVTDSPIPPADESDVIGIVSQHLTARGAQRWLAGYGQRPGGGVLTGTDDHFKTKSAAVKWIIGRRDAAAAAAAGEEVTG